MRPHRFIAVLHGLALAGAGCRPSVPRVEPVVRDYMAMCPPDTHQGVACAQPMATCTERSSHCGPVPTPSANADQPPIPPRCSQHEMRCECVAVSGSASPAWSCRSELSHPAGPQPPPELPSLA